MPYQLKVLEKNQTLIFELYCNKEIYKEGTFGPSVGCGGSGSSSNYEPRYESNSNL
jgi:hypothetical protein